MADKVNTERLRQLARAVTLGREGWSEFSMRVPADPERDADLVLSSAADESEALRAELDALKAEKAETESFVLASGVEDMKCRHGKTHSRIEDCLYCHIVELKATIARQREWIEKAGHRPGCNHWFCRECNADGQTGLARVRHHAHMYHDFQPGPCDCGYAELVGGTNT